MFFFRSFVVSQSRPASLGNEFVLRFRRLPVKKFYWISWEGDWGRREYHDFLSNFLCLAVLKDFIGQRFCAVFQKNTVREKTC